jgi:hypothetical protein
VQLGLVILLVLAIVAATFLLLRALLSVSDSWLKRHMRRSDRRHADRTQRAYRRVVGQFDTQELPRIVDRSSGGAEATARMVRVTGAQPAATRTAAVSERPHGAPGCPTEPGNVPAGQAGGQSGTGRHRRVLAAGTLPASTHHPAPRPGPAPVPGGELRRAS